MIIALENGSKSFGAAPVLQTVNAQIEDGEKIGLVGANGAGKSTLLNIINGDLSWDQGEVRRGSHSIGFLRQNSGLSNDNTINQEVRGAFRALLDMEAEMHALEQQIADHPDNPGLTARYAELQAAFEQQEGYLIEVKIAKILGGMGFGGVDRETPISVLSGGEKTRLALCKLLLEAPELLILDEPTNHLDFPTLLWLEQYLLDYKGALLTVSHDRYFLDKLCGSIWEVERHCLTTYPGNYSQYVRLKEEHTARRQKEYEKQQEEIADLKDFVARNIVRATTSSRAKSKRKALDRMELVERPKAPPKPAKIRFRYKREPVLDVLQAEDLAVSVGEGAEQKRLFSGLELQLLRGDKVALIGANGIGKSSLLRALLGLIPIDSGSIRWGAGVDRSYFEQEEFAMDSRKTALDELWDRFPREYEHTIRTVLGGVGLTGENVYKQVGKLSGGERAKLKFAILMLNCGNMLLMDEPTNHLDLAAKESLDKALQDYTGTLLVVSHDRYLLNKFPTKIAELLPEGLRVYKGNYDSYLRQQERMPAPAPTPRQAAEKPAGDNSYHRSKRQRSEEMARKRRLEGLEKRIEELEGELAALEAEIASPALAADFEALQEKCALLEERRQELSGCMDEWGEL